MDGMWEGVSRARGHKYIYGSFAWMYDKSNRYCKAVINQLEINNCLLKKMKWTEAQTLQLTPEFHLKNYTIWENNKRSTWPLVWWWVVTHNKKSQLTQLGIYIISNIDFYNFIHLLCEGPYSREPKDTLLNEPVTTHPCQTTEKRKHLHESSYNRRSW